MRRFGGLSSMGQNLQRRIIQQGRTVRGVLWTLIVAQVVAVSWVARPWLTGDSGRYLELSRNLLAGKGYVVSCGGKLVTEGWRLPGYPLFLAGIDWFFGPSPAFAIVCQMLLYLASIFLLYRLAKRLGEGAPTIFLLLCAVYPAIAYASALIMTEAVCVFLVSLAIYLIVRPSMTRCAVAGLALGATAYFRPNLLPLGVVVACGMVIAQKKFKPATLVAVFSIATVLPLASWNYVHFRKFTPLPAVGGGGVGLFYGAWESVLPTSELARFQDGAPPSPLLVRSGMVEQLRRISLTVGGPADSTYGGFPTCDARRSELADLMLRRAALRDAKKWPGRYLWHAARVGVTNWLPTLGLRRFPRPIRVLLWIDVVTLPLLGFAGLFKLARHSREARLLGWTALGAAGYFSLSLGWFVSQSRYTVPMRLLLVLGAASFVNSVLGGERDPETRSSEWGMLDPSSTHISRSGRDVEPVEHTSASCQ